MALIIITSTVAIVCSVRSLAMGTVEKRRDGVQFSRKREIGTTSIYGIQFVLKELGVSADAVLTEEVLRGAKPNIDRVRLRVVKYSTKGESRPSTKPDDLETTIVRNNLLKELRFEGTNFLFLFFAVSGITADRVVDQGDEFSVLWESADGVTYIRGVGRIVMVDKVVGSLRATVDLVLSLSGREVGTMVFENVYRIGDGSIERSEGTLRTRGVQATYGVNVRRRKASDSIM